MKEEKKWERVTQEFAPVCDENSRVLILGTAPSRKSREVGFYYGHPQNRFWKMLAAVTGEEVPQTIEEKKALDADCQYFNREICGVKFDKARDYRKPFLPADRMKTVELVTTYPGMLVGTGYAHGTSESDNDIKIGFSFDYVTGQPYVPGSSVKGLLRCVFREQPEAAAEIVRVCTGKALDIDRIAELEKEIFDAHNTLTEGTGAGSGYRGWLDLPEPNETWY